MMLGNSRDADIGGKCFLCWQKWSNANLDSQKLGEFLEAHKWMDGIATLGEVVETILPYVYTRYEEEDEVWAARVEVDEGIFN